MQSPEEEELQLQLQEREQQRGQNCGDISIFVCGVLF